MDYSKIVPKEKYNFLQEKIYQAEIRIRQMVNEEVVKVPTNSTHVDIYTIYPYIFADGFPEIDPRVLEDLSVYSRLYLTHCMFIDRVVDSEADPELVFLANIYLEESLKILSKYFPANHLFWDYYATYKKQYIKANKDEKLIQKKLNLYTLDRMKDIAIGKASLTKSVTTALALICDKNEYIVPLEKSQDYYNLATQFVDDLKDWKVDYRNNNHSYLLKSCYDLIEMNESALIEERIDFLGKVMYFEGIANFNLRSAEQYYQRSIEMLHNTPFNYWSSLVISYTQEIVNLKNDLETLKNKEIRKRFKNNREIAFSLDAIQESVSKGINFLESMQHDDGRWVDFFMLPGYSDVWVTAYVGNQIKGISQSAAKNAAKRAKAYLMQRLEDFNFVGWGYNLNTPMDADSTAQALLFLHEQLDTDKKNRIIQNLLQQQNSDGGIGTYSKKRIHDAIFNDSNPFFEASIDYYGWCLSHQSVSAAVGIALTEANHPALERLIGYIEKEYLTGFWRGYWWDDIYYPTYYCERFLALQRRSRIHEITSKISSLQNKDGGWANGIIAGESIPFYTALALKILLLNTNLDALNERIKKGVEWLLNSQLEDGGWEFHRIMRVPYPGVTAPWDLAREDFINKSKGNIMNDLNRIFTTSTVINMLDIVLKILYERR